MGEHPDVISLQRQFGGSLGSPQSVLGDGLLALAGVWVALSPWVLGFYAIDPAVGSHNLVLGLVAAAVGLGITGLAERGGGLSWVAVPLGVWLIISTWVVPAMGPSAGLVWSNVVAGAVMILTGAGVATVALMGTRRNAASAD
jgi:hypothetical protein